jgi:hypothetical protein
MTDFRLRAIGRPGDCQNIEAGLAAEQAMSMEKNQSQVGEAALLSVVDRFRRPTAIFALCGTHFDEDHALAVESDQIQFTPWTREVAAEDAIAQSLLEKPGRGPL